MSVKQFDSLLNDTINLIETSLRNKVKDQINKEANKVRKESNYSKLIEKKEKLEKELEQIETELSTKDGELDYGNYNYASKRMGPMDTNRQFKDHIPSCIRHIKFGEDRTWHVSEWTAFKRIEESSKELINLIQFQAIAKQYKELYGMAITIKEKRNVLLQLRGLDWRQLGIEMPTIMCDFSINNGTIVSSIKQLTN